VPIVFWSADRKLDVLFDMRTNPDPREYSCVLQAYLETSSVVSLAHIFI
jgi:hypothetical protein